MLQGILGKGYTILMLQGTGKGFTILMLQGTGKGYTFLTLRTDTLHMLGGEEYRFMPYLSPLFHPPTHDRPRTHARTVLRSA